MSHLKLMGLLLGLVLPVDHVCVKCRDWHATQLAIKRGTTATAKFALWPHSSGAMS
jgi:hypothetical protein